jgi:hypothetical protein
MQGLSHYLEHMLFMGSQQFPDENEYDSFLTKHGGSSNAFTELVRVAMAKTRSRHYSRTVALPFLDRKPFQLFLGRMHCVGGPWRHILDSSHPTVARCPDLLCSCLCMWLCLLNLQHNNSNCTCLPL